MRASRSRSGRILGVSWHDEKEKRYWKRVHGFPDVLNVRNSRCLDFGSDRTTRPHILWVFSSDNHDDIRLCALDGVHLESLYGLLERSPMRLGVAFGAFLIFWGFVMAGVVWYAHGLYEQRDDLRVCEQYWNVSDAILWNAYPACVISRQVERGEIVTGLNVSVVN